MAIIWILILVHMGTTKDTVLRVGRYQTVEACIIEAKVYKTKYDDDIKLCTPLHIKK